LCCFEYQVTRLHHVIIQTAVRRIMYLDSLTATAWRTFNSTTHSFDVRHISDLDFKSDVFLPLSFFHLFLLITFGFLRLLLVLLLFIFSSSCSSFAIFPAPSSTSINSIFEVYSLASSSLFQYHSSSSWSLFFFYSHSSCTLPASIMFSNSLFL